MDAENLELDGAEADYDFSLSVAVGLWFLAALWVVLKGSGTLVVAVLLAVGGIVFLLEGYWQLRYSVQPIVDELIAARSAQPYPQRPAPKP